MAQKTTRRLAADILGIGETRIWFDPSQTQRIGEALTRDDVRALLKEGIIQATPKMGVSRLRGRERAIGKRAGRRRGHGSRKGTAAARSPPKTVWMAKVRSQRKIINELRESGELAGENFRKIYMMVKGNAFRGKNALRIYLQENNLVKTKAPAKK